jgi:hypothetical protein
VDARTAALRLALPIKSCTVTPEQATSRYNLSFTAASLRPELARIVASHYLSTGSWDEAKRRVLDSNALQSRSPASAVRMEREFRQRLATLSGDQLTLLVEATAEDAAAITWLAALKHSAFLFEFAAEVLREKLEGYDPVLRHSDYEDFVEGKSLLHPELAALTESTKGKVRRVLLRMLTEAGLLSAGAALGTIRRPVLAPAVMRVVAEDDPRWLGGFLVPEHELARA